MSLSLRQVPDGFDLWGKTKVFAFDVTFDTSYPLSTGYVINASDVGLSSFKGIQVLGGNKAAGALLAFADLASVATDSFLAKSLALRLFLPSGGASAPATLVAPVAGATTPGAFTVGGTATATPAAGVTPVTSTGAQPAIPVDLSAVTVSQAAGTGGAVTAGIGKEVGNTTDVSSVIFRILFMGN